MRCQETPSAAARTRANHGPCRRIRPGPPVVARDLNNLAQILRDLEGPGGPAVARTRAGLAMWLVVNDT
jgi:hypothetical protein